MSSPLDKPLAARLADALGDAYTIEGEVGRGGMGVVYRATDNRLQRRVAIKVLPPELAFQQDIRERFTREAQTAARLSHPHIVPIHTVGDGQGLVYFVMGYVDGESVGARLKRRGKLPPDEARRIMKETADALSAAHAVSIIHRDIKPDNILLEGTRGRVMVTDFGIAKALSSSSGATLTGAGVAIGTPSFMSPEQAAGEREIDGRSDLYSLGIVSYQMLTGELPFQAPTVAGILMKQITEPAPDLRIQRRDVPEDLALAVSRCLEKDPENRWPTADALRRALESRTVTGYEPTGLGWKASRPAARDTGRGTRDAWPRDREVERSRGSAAEPPGRRPMALDRRPSRLPRPPRQSDDWEYRRHPRKRDDHTPVPDTGEPRIIQRVRGQFARWAAISLGTFGINIATGLDTPWFLFPTFGMAIGLFRDYARLWQAGYSWRDVLARPPAPDAIGAGGARAQGRLPRQLPNPSPSEFGDHYLVIKQMRDDRNGILRLVDGLPADTRKDLAEVPETVDGLYSRAMDLARSLTLMQRDVADDGSVGRIEARLAELEASSPGDERTRQIELLERQRKSLADLQTRRQQMLANLESCRLAMQNLRYDMLKLKTSDIAAVMGDLTQATQQARAVSRNVDNAIAAAAEVKEALK
ncbi:MAG TPA: protein kinase [Gemmatimonadales bacterium]|jgi:serine/threonine-protein kinase|nr:protein kinase [Gemmatimonadales bacterium]